MASALLISVVDDDDAARNAISGLIRSMGHRVAEFSCGADFLELAELERTSFLIADLRMPAMTGFELHQRVLALGAAIPTALVTAYPSEASRAQARAAGVAHLIKPVSPSDLASWLAQVGRSPAG